MPERPMNIKDLILEDPPPERELPFDPERDITTLDWQEMTKQLTKDRTDNRWWDFFSHAMAMQLLFPDRVSELGLDEPAWQGMTKLLAQYKTAKNWGIFSWQATEMKILAADDAHITNDGQIAITMRRPSNDFTHPIPPLPEVRRF